MSTCFRKCQFSSVIVQDDNVVDDGARHAVHVYHAVQVGCKITCSDASSRCSAHLRELTAFSFHQTFIFLRHSVLIPSIPDPPKTYEYRLQPRFQRPSTITYQVQGGDGYTSASAVRLLKSGDESKANARSQCFHGLQLLAASPK